MTYIDLYFLNLNYHQTINFSCVYYLCVCVALYVLSEHITRQYIN